MGYKHTPGYATWKFVINGKIIYRHKNADALKYYWNNRDQYSFTVYVRTKNGWEFVARRQLSDRCQCGRSYDETANGEVFRFQEHPLVMTIKALSELMSSPILCQVCYYKRELKEGRWAPKYVKKQLGLET